MIKSFYDSNGGKKFISIPVCLMVLQVHQEYTESITFPRNVIICVGINTDFFSCIKNPKFCNKQYINVTNNMKSELKWWSDNITVQRE
jgi:hypothetical protein